VYGSPLGSSGRFY